MELSDSKVELVARKNKVVYQDGSRVVKVFNGTKPAGDVFNEALNVARIVEAGVAAPKVLDVSEYEPGCWGIQVERLAGKTLAEVMEAEPENKAKFLDQFVRLQLEIQGHSAPLLPRQKDKFVRMIKSVDAINATTRYDLLMRLDGMKVEEKVCHGDFNPTNVLVDGDKMAVLDWAHATQGTPAADVAMTYMEFSFADADLADAYLDAYCEKADMPKQLVFQWLPIVAAAELARGHKDNEEALLSWIDVADWQ